MKNKMFLLLFLMTIGVVSNMKAKSLSGLAPASGLASYEMGKVIKEKISPEVLVDENLSEATVLVEFEMNSAGEIHVLHTNESNKKVKDYVVSELEKMHLSNTDLVPATYQIKLCFKLIY